MAQGDSWELAVAVPIKNNKFQLGDYKKAKLASELIPNAKYLEVSDSLEDGTLLNNYLQYNDEVLVGKSSHSSNLESTKRLNISGVEEQTGKQRLHLINRDNDKYFSIGDEVYFYGTGLAGGWELISGSSLNDYIQTEGIRQGLISKHSVRSFAEAVGTTLVTGQFYKEDLDDTLIMKRHNGEHGFLVDFPGFDYQYIKVPLNDDNELIVAVESDFNQSTVYGLYGDYHRGGWRKEYAQRIKFQIGSSVPSGWVMKQNLLDYGDSTDNVRKKSLVVPYQYYRIGGKAYLDLTQTTSTYNNDFNLSLSLRPHSLVRDTSEEVKVDLFGSSNVNTNKWYEFSTIDLLESGISNEYPPELALYFYNKYSASADNGDAILYLDEVWVDMAGGINYGETDGCLKFSRYHVWPIQEELSIEFLPEKNYYKKRNKYRIRTRFEDVSQDFWDQLEILLEWQRKGYYLNLHVNINDVDGAIMGKIYIDSVDKSFWHLGYRSFDMIFEEA